MSSLTIFEGKFHRLQEERDNIIKAKEALELADPGEWLGGIGFDDSIGIGITCRSPFSSSPRFGHSWG